MEYTEENSQDSIQGDAWIFLCFQVLELLTVSMTIIS